MTYANHILRVNLKTKEIKREPINLDIAQEYLGGRGYGVKILYDELKSGINPLSADNKVVIMTGPMTGTTSPTTSRWCMVFKSPLTERTLNDTHCGGRLGIEIKRAGYDGIIIEDASDTPVYLLINAKNVLIQDATNLWGKTIDETEGLLKKRHSGHSVAAIGPAGENLVHFACVINGTRTAGRGGIGAVWGSKKLKAVVVRGNGKVVPVNQHAFRKVNKKFLEILKGHPVTGTGMGLYGTPILVNIVNKHGVLPVKNFSTGIFDDVRQIAGETLREYLVKKEPCRGCPIACGRIMKYKEIETQGPEYESLWALGPNCGISDLETIFKANSLCNKLGLDTISTGNVIGWFMECSEKKIIPNAIPFGDGQALLSLIENIAYRRNEGDLLANGVRNAANQIGKETTKFACHVKGLELPAYDPRGIKGMALSYVTSNSGGTHLKAYTVIQEVLSLPHFVDPFAEEEKANLVKNLQDVFAALDSAEWCKFTAMAVFSTFKCEVEIYAKLLTTATGFYIDEDEFRKIGERIYNLERLFNIREGLTKENDVLPSRFQKESLPEGPAKGHTLNINGLLKEYYNIRGWGDLGIPSDRKLGELNIQPIKTHTKLQIALDLRDLDEALKIAQKSALGGVDWIEAGTPLIKATGIESVSKLRQLFPHKTIVADLKTMDASYLETEMAALAGADIVCILGIAPDSTIKDAVGAGKKFGVKIFADLIGIKDPINRAIDLEKLGVDIIGLHIGIDQQLRSDFDKIPFPTLKRLREIIKIPIAVAGGLKAETIPKAIECGADIIIVGSAITRSANPQQATLHLKNVILTSKDQ
ncbi:MAG: orotidine 5'-phosphate decarboxylase [Candidatus Heimdallarchaeota archaeon]|nr:MAG: orotidine 5'-phosphate decarboxylase [Candidatus Heimdallarchaeota archaeon]